MTAQTIRPSRYLAARRFVPSDLKGAWICNLDDSSSLAIAYLIKRRMKDRVRPQRIVFVDLDRAVYACRPDSASAELLVIAHPELLVGMYDDEAQSCDIAADLEQHRREFS